MPFTLCVGAASRRVIEEASNLRVHQIVASRRQVGEFEPGYTGHTSATFVQTVKQLSGGATDVVRDHGGPYQNGDGDDNWVLAFDVDVDAGFDVLHLDVSALPRGDQQTELARLCERYSETVDLEVGGERDTQVWLDALLETALKTGPPQTAVGEFGGEIWADRQRGHLSGNAQAIAARYATHGVTAKAHNLDWMGGRALRAEIDGLYNVAPEFGNVEIDAWLSVLTHDDGLAILDFAYQSDAWRRWFTGVEGTWFERARAALRYHLETPHVTRILDRYDDRYVRKTIRDAIIHG